MFTLLNIMSLKINCHCLLFYVQVVKYPTLSLEVNLIVWECRTRTQSLKKRKKNPPNVIFHHR